MAGTAKHDDDLEVDSLAAGWDMDDDDDDEDAVEDDVDSLAAGWESPKRGRTAAEKARARREKAWMKAEKRKAHAAAIAQKQKQKQPKARPADDAPARADRAVPEPDGEEATAPRSEPPRPKKKAAKATKTPLSQFGMTSWIALGAIVLLTLAALAYALH